ncbi:hypothetical protein EPN16_06390 [bacterium]|nr:MAG: hypothetical protein EPN16_06390 [bacterium]
MVKFKLFILIILSLSLSGCLMMWIGAGAAGGYALGRDYIQGDTDKNFDSVYDSAVNIAEGMGIIQSRFSNPSLGKIRASVGSSRVDILIERLTLETVRLRVKSRKNLMPNLELAQRIYNNILQQSGQ